MAAPDFEIQTLPHSRKRTSDKTRELPADITRADPVETKRHRRQGAMVRDLDNEALSEHQ
jgi:hypothetical protein